MKNSTILFAMIVLIFIVGGFIFVNSQNKITANVISSEPFIEGQIQKVVLSQDKYNYKDASAQSGKPIVLSADNSVGGCLRSVAFNIDGKKYSKYLKTEEDTLELPALSKGTYTFSCSMGMGFGKLIVQ